MLGVRGLFRGGGMAGFRFSSPGWQLQVYGWGGVAAQWVAVAVQAQDMVVQVAVVEALVQLEE